MASNIVHLDDCIWKDYLSAQSARLPPLEQVEQISNRVVRILGGNPGPMQLQGTNTYIVGTGESRILIDTGEGIPIWIDHMRKFLKYTGVHLAYILLTHWHGDHTGGIADLISLDHSLENRIYKHTPDPGQQAIADTQAFTVPGATVKAIYTPGHSTDHMCFILEEEKALFTGDNILGHGFSVEEDLKSYTISLHRMAELGCTAGYPAHGAKINDLSLVLDRYIRHKEQRELQIMEALRRLEGTKDAHSLSVQALIHAVHGDLPSHVVSLGLEPFITQILWKLAEERKVGFEYVMGNRQWFLHKRFRQLPVTDA